MISSKGKYKPGKKGQSILDYVIFLTVVIAALLIIGLYVRNSLSGKIREGADVFGQGETYLPNVNGVNNPTNVDFSVTNQP